MNKEPGLGILNFLSWAHHSAWYQYLSSIITLYTRLSDLLCPRDLPIYIYIAHGSIIPSIPFAPAARTTGPSQTEG